MVDHLPVTPGSGSNVATDEIGGVHFQRVKVTFGADGAAADVSKDNPIPVMGKTLIAGGNFSRPANTDPYAAGDLVANALLANAVGAIQITAARVNGGTGRILRASLAKSTGDLTNAQFRVHLYKNDPAAAAGISFGDNGAWLTKQAGYLGSFDITMESTFSDAAKGFGAPSVGAFISFETAAGSQLLYALVEARAPYAPASAESFTLALEIDQD